MRKYLTLIIALIIFSESPAQSKTFKRIGIVNPVKGNLERIVFLVQNDFIKIDSLQIVGVFHYSQKELLISAKQYVDDHSYNFISFEILNYDIPFDSLFCINSCSSDFLRIFNETDAMFFLGGADIPPKIYGEKAFLTTELISKGRNWELSFLYHLTGGFQNDYFIPFLEKRPDYLILGICLGMQEMNVASGGTLNQDIPYQIYGIKSYDEITKLPIEKQHKNYWERIDNWKYDLSAFNFHHIRIAKNSYLSIDSINRSPIVASGHHQSVKKLGKHYKMSATSMDKKVIEAFSNTKYKNVYGIQFHTDFPALYEDSSVFKVSPDNVIRLDMDSKQFYIDFWKDLCKKLYNQK